MIFEGDEGDEEVVEEGVELRGVGEGLVIEGGEEVGEVAAEVGEAVGSVPDGVVQEAVDRLSRDHTGHGDHRNRGRAWRKGFPFRVSEIPFTVLSDKKHVWALHVHRYRCLGQCSM